MEILQLDVRPRDLSTSAKSLRKNSKVIPAIYYGKGEKSIPLEMDYQTFRKLYIKAGSTQLVDLKFSDKETKKVLIHDVQFHPLTGTVQHVDFLHVNLKEEVTTEVPVEIVGVAPAVKDLGGILNTVKHQVTVRCLPTDIPQTVNVDVSGLVEFSNAIHISDLTLPKGVKVLDAPEDVVAIVNAPKVEVEAPVEAAPVEGAPAEGAAAAEGEQPAGEEK